MSITMVSLPFSCVILLSFPSHLYLRDAIASEPLMATYFIVAVTIACNYMFMNVIRQKFALSLQLEDEHETQAKHT